MNRDNDRQTSIILAVLGILPIAWLGLLIAPSVKGGLPEILPKMCIRDRELGHAQLAMNCEAYSRRDMGFSAVCVGYMLCRKFGVDVKNFAIDRIPEELAGKSPKEIRAELSKTRSAMSEIGSRVSEEIYRRRADRNKEQER